MDHARLAQLNIRNVIDLRSNGERSAFPHGLANVPTVNYSALSQERVTGNLTRMLKQHDVTADGMRTAMIELCRGLSYQVAEAYRKIFPGHWGRFVASGIQLRGRQRSNRRGGSIDIDIFGRVLGISCPRLLAERAVHWRHLANIRVDHGLVDIWRLQSRGSLGALRGEPDISRSDARGNHQPKRFDRNLLPVESWRG